MYPELYFMKTRRVRWFVVHMGLEFLGLKQALAFKKQYMQ